MTKWEDVGLGIVLAKLRFHVHMEKTHVGIGFRLRRKIFIKFSSDNEEKLVRLFTTSNNLPALPVSSKKNIQEWMDVIAFYGGNLLSNYMQYDKMLFTIENPMPTKSMEAFVEWAEKYDLASPL